MGEQKRYEEEKYKFGARGRLVVSGSAASGEGLWSGRRMKFEDGDERAGEAANPGNISTTKSVEKGRLTVLMEILKARDLRTVHSDNARLKACYTMGLRREGRMDGGWTRVELEDTNPSILLPTR